MNNSISNSLFMNIQCDYREKDVISALDNIRQKKDKFKNINITKDNLNLGDFIVNNTIIVERKTWSDLGASINDGRYREQGTRLQKLIEENPGKKVFYFIEGNSHFYVPRGHVTIEALHSALFSLQYEKGFNVLQTNSVGHTAEMLLKISEKQHKSKKNNVNEMSGGNNESCEIPLLQTTKKNSQINKDNIGPLMLSCIPGISHLNAQSILSHFNNDIYEFLFEVNHDISCLDNIKVNNRKLSKAIIENIKKLLIN